MPKKLKLTEFQTNLKSELEILYNQIWQYIESDQKSLSHDDANRIYNGSLSSFGVFNNLIP